MNDASVSPVRPPVAVIAMAVAAVACLALVQASFFLPQMLEWELQSMQSGVNKTQVARGGLLLLVALLILGCVFVNERKKTASEVPPEGWFVIFALSLLVPTLISAMISGRSDAYMILHHASSAHLNVEKAEVHLGRATEAGNLLRASMQSMDALRGNAEFVEKMGMARHSPKDAMDVASMAYILGIDNPVVAFTIESGLVQEDAVPILSRDVLEYLQKNPNLSADPQVALLLSRLGN